jgi:hypothetical protein
MTTSILWERLDMPGFDRATVAHDAAGYRIAGTALFSRGGASYDIRYSVIVDTQWNTRVVAAHVDGPDGERRLSLRADEDGRWTTGEEVLPDFDGVRDVDLAFTPATNTLPIRRLGLVVGEGADIDVAYVAFPDRRMGRETRRYERLADDVYRYSVGGRSLDLSVQGDGLVTGFPEHWRAIA